MGWKSYILATSCAYAVFYSAKCCMNIGWWTWTIDKGYRTNALWMDFSPIIWFGQLHIFVFLLTWTTWFNLLSVWETLLKKHFSIRNSPVSKKLVRGLLESVRLTIMNENRWLVHNWHSSERLLRVQNRVNESTNHNKTETSNHHVVFLLVWLLVFLLTASYLG